MSLVHWIIIPVAALPVLFVLASFIPYMRGKTGSKAYDPKTGIGRGAPGFQTNVRRVAVTPEIAARIRAGEQVSAEEITASQAEAARRAEAGEPLEGLDSKGKVRKQVKVTPQNEWLPEVQQTGGGKRKGKK